jgi:RNAse (barnase) inhibitor barstar
MTQYSVDLSDINSRAGLHNRLAQAFSFPDYYDRNWDAFDECIADLTLPVSILVSGFESLRFVLPREAKLFAKCLHWAAERAAPGEFEFSGLP